MKFIIERTRWDKENKCPIEGAVLENLLMKYRKFEKMEERWTIDISTLEDLINVNKKIGKRIILSFPSFSPVGIITIYDGYIE